MKPNVQPNRPGSACWDPSYAERMISSVARVGDDHAAWFLSTHSPITCTTPGFDELSEREVFERLYDSAGEEYLVVVKGGPGAGKSQLINWLKLRFDEAMAHGRRPAHRSASLRTVMIKRRSGSLKDALQQLVDQLPGYERYLADVSTAISELGSEQANRKLCFALATAIHAARQTAPRSLRHLSELFNDVGTIEHMARPGGVVSEYIARLTTGADTDEHGTLPEFTGSEFVIPRRRTAVDSELIDLLEDDATFREQAAQETNKHLRSAIADLTGLRGQTLYEVFRSIRKDLRRANECLAFFVEDVSTLSVLDEELVNAVEPQNDGQLCEMLSVLGMTIPSHTKLPPNLKDRIDLVLEIKGEQKGQSDLSDPTYADQFTARYLNALRAGENQLQRVVEGRQHQGDISDIACEGCNLQDACFATFGFTSLGRARVGLFPFSPGTVSRLLNGLNSTVAATPRDLLQKILDPLLRAAHREFNRDGSTVGLDIAPRTPADTAAKRGILLGGWNNQQQDRLSYFVWYWTGAETLEQGAGRLKPMLEWFGLPPFSSTVKTVPLPDPGVRPPRPPAVKPEPTAPPAYEAAIRRLDVWFQKKGKLEKDKEYRDYLVDVVKRSVQTESYRSPSADQRARTKKVDAGNIEIEDMVAKPSAVTHAKFEFRRNEETYALLKALCDYNYKGKSWSFEGAEAQRRVYAKWLRSNEQRIVAAYAVDRVDPIEAWKLAIRFLILAYRFCARKELPTDTSLAVQLLVSFKPEPPASLSTIGNGLAADAMRRIETIRKMLLDGLNIPQGDRGGLNFIDPTLIIQSLSEEPRPIGLPAIEGDAWEAGHFGPLWRLSKSPWNNLEPYFEEEAAAMDARLTATRNALSAWGIHGDTLEQNLREFLEGAREVAKALELTNQSTGDPDLQRRIAGFAPAEVNRQIAPIVEVETLLSTGDKAAVITCDVGRFIKHIELVEAVHALMKKCAESLERSATKILTEAELDLERHRAKESLDLLVTIAAV